jgi:hypothetical protein
MSQLLPLIIVMQRFREQSEFFKEMPQSNNLTLSLMIP